MILCMLDYKDIRQYYIQYNLKIEQKNIVEDLQQYIDITFANGKYWNIARRMYNNMRRTLKRESYRQHLFSIFIGVKSIKLEISSPPVHTESNIAGP